MATATRRTCAGTRAGTSWRSSGGRAGTSSGRSRTPSAGATAMSTGSRCAGRASSSRCSGTCSRTRRDMTRVALAATGDPLAPATWSGTPQGVARGLRAHGADVVGVDATPPAGIRQAALALAAARRRSRVDAWYTPGLHALRSRAAARRLGAVDGAVLMGAEFGLPEGTRYVTLSDLTLVQARGTHPVFSRLSEPVFRAWQRRQREIYERATACCAASHWTADSLRADYDLPAEKVRVVGLGPNHEPAAGSAERPWAPPRFLFVGREWERKHGPSVLGAFASLRAERPDARLALVGGHPPVRGDGVTGHGALRLDVPEEAARVRELFEQATCFVMPSEVEPFGIVYVEASAAGVPSIATSVGGAGTVVTEESGICVSPGDPGALVAA